MSPILQQAREIFLHVVGQLPTEQWDDYVARVTTGNPELAEAVDFLLRSHREAGSFLEQPAVPLAPTIDQPVTERPGMQIGPYKLLQEIGHGGMGIVFMAEQHEPVRRKVALKIIKPGMDSRQVLARFEAERQALSLMDHPNIAKVLDAGTTSSGRPYFVMELVKGQPITQYCDENKLTPRERLELLLPVCHAIQHAHQKGIIHRDIKPSNILVAEYDQKPVPKIIDFGVAKATSQPLTEKTMFTGFGQVVGTLEYMSPEQAKVNQLDIDTRSDIYSLGVLMYELLTGSTPFDRKRLKQAAWDEMLRIIREEDPPKPSTRLFDSKDSLPSISAQRHTEPAKLTKLVRGELDWIVMKALEKDRSRRYETANGFAMDLQRYLNDEAVSACPPSAGYRFRKFVRRNKGPVLAANLIVLALLAGIAGTAWQAIRAENARQKETRQRELAEESAAAEKAAKLDADAKRQEAERNRAYAKKGNDILGSVFAGLDPKANYASVAELRNALRDNLTKAVKDLEGSAIGDPLEVAAMQNKLGASLMGLGEANLAIEVLSKALTVGNERLGADHPNTLVLMNNLANGYRAVGKMDEALPLMEKTLNLSIATLGVDHPDTLLYMHTLAMGYRDVGKMDKALPLHEETLKLNTARGNHPHTLKFMDSLASAYKNVGKMDKALPLHEEALRLSTAKLGADHPDTLICMGNLASAYQNVGKMDKALPLFEETFKLSTSKLGVDHPNTLEFMGNLAMAYLKAKKEDKVLPLFEEALRLSTAKLGADHPKTFNAMNRLALGYQAVGKLDKALTLFEETLNLRSAKLGADHPDTLTSMNNLATYYRDVGQMDKALPLMEKTLRLMTAKMGVDHPDTITSMGNLAFVYQKAEMMDKALPLMEETLKLKIAKLGADHPDTLVTMINFALCYQANNQNEKALELFEKTLKLRTAKHGSEHRDTASSMAFVGSTFIKLKKWNEAENILRECLATREKLQPDAWNTFNTRSLLGQALLGQKKYAEAGPLLCEGYDGMKEREKSIPANSKKHLVQALDRLVQLYTETNKPEEVKKWQTEKDKRTLTLEKK